MKRKADNDKPNARDKMMETFVESLVKRLEEIKVDWKQPWINPAALEPPRNIDGRPYGGMNTFFLMLERQEKGYEMPLWMTYLQAEKMGVNIRKGEHGFPVFFYHQLIKDKDKNVISEDEFRNLSKEEQEECTRRWNMTVYRVFNVSQTNMQEMKPEMWQKFSEKFNDATRFRNVGEDGYRNLELDYMLDKGLWLCPVETKISSNAYYSISKDTIVVPEMKQFVDNESFYSTLLHEMAHSTGAESRLDRIKPQKFGSEEYAREELVAELTSVVAGASLGVSRTVKEESVAYLQSWLDSLKKDPSFIRTIVADVKKAADTIESVTLSEEIRNGIIDGKKQHIADFMAERRKEEEAPKTISYEELKEKSVSLKGTERNLSATVGEGKPLPQDDKEIRTLLKQYDGLKRKHPDALLIFRHGDAYSLYLEDADKASQTIGLKTQVNEYTGKKGNLSVTSVTFPYADLDTWLPKFVRAGHRVAIVDSAVSQKQTRREQPEKRQEVSVEEGQEKPVVEEGKFRHSYMLLGRLVEDCRYYLESHGGEEQLWAKNVEKQIQFMRGLWESMDEKPQWLTQEQLEYYASRMLQEKADREAAKSRNNDISNSKTDMNMEEKNEQKKEIRDGASIFKNKYTSLYQISVAKDGKEAKAIDVRKPDLDKFFTEAKGKSREEIQQLKDNLAKSYFEEDLTPKMPVHEDGVLMFKMPKLGEGVYGITMVKDGQEGTRRRLDDADTKAYFEAIKAAAPEDKAAVIEKNREKLAGKYLSPEALKAREEAKAKYESSQKERAEIKPLPEVSAANRKRISEPEFWKSENGTYFAKAVIDGKPVDKPRAVSEEKMAAFFPGYKGADKDVQLEKRAQLVNAVFADVLQGRSRGRGR